MLTRIGTLATAWAAQSPWTNVYGLARTLLALGTLLTLVTTPTAALFTPTNARPGGPSCLGPASIGVFCVVPPEALEVARFLAIAILVVAASGWRPRLTAVPHWWVAFSVATSASVIDGGDHVTQVLTLLLLPVALTDSRRWHWHAGSPAAGSTPIRLVALFALTAIRVQVAGIYAQSSIAKLAVPEWIDGTVMYYWLTDPTYGAPGWLQPILLPLISSGLVALISWPAVFLEFMLMLGLVANKRLWPYLLGAGLVFHALIAVSIGLVSFGFAMSAALILYLRPVQQRFEPRWNWLLSALPALFNTRVRPTRHVSTAATRLDT